MLENHLEFARDAIDILLETSAMVCEDISFVHDGQCTYIKIARTGQYFYMNPIEYENIEKKKVIYYASEIERKRKRECYDEYTPNNNKKRRAGLGRTKQTIRQAIGQ